MTWFPRLHSHMQLIETRAPSLNLACPQSNCRPKSLLTMPHPFLLVFQPTSDFSSSNDVPIVSACRCRRQRPTWWHTATRTPATTPWSPRCPPQKTLSGRRNSSVLCFETNQGLLLIQSTTGKYIWQISAKGEKKKKDLSQKCEHLFSEDAINSKRKSRQTRISHVRRCYK